MPSLTKIIALSRASTNVLHSLPGDHPFSIALRTYMLSLSLSLGPTLFPFLASPRVRAGGIARIGSILRRELGPTGFACAMTVSVSGGYALARLWESLSAVEGRAFPKGTQSICGRLVHFLCSIQDLHRTFLAYMLSSSVAITLLQARTRNRVSPDSPGLMALPFTSLRSESGPQSSPTTDLTLLLLVRALDSAVQAGIKSSIRPLETTKREDFEIAEKNRRRLRTAIDVAVFWACSAR